MSDLNQSLSSLQSATRLTGGVISQVEGLFGGAAAIATWYGRLQQASFRGVPFGVLESETRFGRRIAVHEYPYRDAPYVEDLGRSTRRFNVIGFLVSDSAIYGGGDVLQQRERMVAAVEAAGVGELVHPTLGRLLVNIAEGGFVVTERWDHGRYFEIAFSFLESGERLFPLLLSSTGDDVDAAADAADAAASGDFASRVLGPLKQGAAIVGMAVSTAQIWARTASRLSSDATNLKNMASTLKGNNGRYAKGATSGGLSKSAVGLATAAGTVRSLISQGATARANVAGASSALSSSASGLEA